MTVLRHILAFSLVLLALIGINQVNAATVHVDIKKFNFVPQQLTIAVGDTVVWTNREKRQYHSVWFKEAGDVEPDYFFPDETYQRTFNAAGTFNYLCGPHPKMTGVVTVK